MSETETREASVRHRLPITRKSITHKFTVGGHEGYIIVGMYEDGKPGELFIRMAKEGSTISGFVDSFAIAVSIALQRGVPLLELADKFIATSFDPSGPTLHSEIERATSIPDYVFKYMMYKFEPEMFAQKFKQQEVAG